MREPREEKKSIFTPSLALLKFPIRKEINYIKVLYIE